MAVGRPGLKKISSGLTTEDQNWKGPLWPLEQIREKVYNSDSIEC